MGLSWSARRRLDAGRRGEILEWLSVERVERINALREREGKEEVGRELLATLILRMGQAEWADLKARTAEGRRLLSRAAWIEMYGGSELIAREGFEVVRCFDCDDSACKGWRVRRPLNGRTESLEGGH